MKNRLTILGLSIAICTFLVAQGNVTHRVAPGDDSPTFVQEKQDTGKHKMHKKNWKKGKDSSMRKDTTTRY
jgi:hypothetical protein